MGYPGFRARGKVVRPGGSVQAQPGGWRGPAGSSQVTACITFLSVTGQSPLPADSLRHDDRTAPGPVARTKRAKIGTCRVRLNRIVAGLRSFRWFRRRVRERPCSRGLRGSGRRLRLRRSGLMRNPKKLTGTGAREKARPWRVGVSADTGRTSRPSRTRARDHLYRDAARPGLLTSQKPAITPKVARHGPSTSPGQPAQVTHPGRRHAEPLRRPAKVQLLGHRKERLDLAHLQMQPPDNFVQPSTPRR